MRAIIYTTDFCGYCHQAKEKLKELGIKYTEINMSDDAKMRQDVIKMTGQMTSPQIFLHLGGADDLDALDEAGVLQPILQHL